MEGELPAIPVEALKIENAVTSRFDCIDDSKTSPKNTANSVEESDECYVSIKAEHQKLYNFIPCSEEKTFEKAETIGTQTMEPVIKMKPWAFQIDPTNQEQKLDLSYAFPKPYMCSVQSSFQEDVFFQLDYKTRNKFKTKQRRMNPSYRDQERIRQRTVMQLKRRDPHFRAEEREKGRFRMRIKRLDPVFRSKERERQRERMKLKRQDPSFRERERAQQKSRICEKHPDPGFREREKCHGRLRMSMKQSNGGNPMPNEGVEVSSIPGNTPMYYTDANNSIQGSHHNRQSIIEQATLYEHNEQANNTKSVIVKGGESFYDSFHCISPCVLNLHLCNNGKEHCHASMEKGPTNAFFNIFKENRHQHSTLIDAENQRNNDNVIHPHKQAEVRLEHSQKSKVVVTAKSKKIQMPSSRMEQQLSSEIRINEQKKNSL